MSTTRARPRTRGKAVQQEWQLQEARARFGEVFRLAREQGPQRVTKRGGEAVVVLTAEEYARLAASDAQGRPGRLLFGITAPWFGH